MYGFPQKILCDNGTSFTSEEYSSFLKECASIKQLHSSNGVVERFHGTMKHRMDKLLFEKHNIRDALGQALFDIRRSSNAATGRSPHFLFLGREMPNILSKVNGSRNLQANKLPVTAKSAAINTRTKARDLDLQTGQTISVTRGKKKIFCHYFIPSRTWQLQGPLPEPTQGSSQPAPHSSCDTQVSAHIDCS